MTTTSLFRRSLLTMTALLVIGFSVGAARADEVFIAGNTNGCFGALCVPGNTASIPGLDYSDSVFAGTTAGGFRALGGNANPGFNLNNLGSFVLSTAPNTFNTTFTLQVNFTAPQGINGSSTALFVATVTGTVVADDNGGVFIDFDNTPQLFTFNDVNCGPTTIPGQQTTCGVGSFNFSVIDVSIDPGQTAALSGLIFGAQQSTIPEPASMILLGTGLVGAMGVIRKRFKKN